jgi:hypothetical protein
MNEATKPLGKAADPLHDPPFHDIPLETLDNLKPLKYRGMPQSLMAF